ncbi:BspA family leucine-rich repeat surface protein [Flavobacterium rakeshii]|uniref:BspA family leucine-rich repeat surface protein n=1 Tax=Flavobacterium rakeshii TaxID=1038845 RepID=UPI002E7AB25D|nr:BspA family leucine-rich repeat surface protein [Flavobacterium rakeshii]MEE1898439.1 BspA family leucine-rich repeat surface protein [Flavobacterium rakeshii]
MKKTSLTLLLFFLTSFIYAQEPFITTWEVFDFDLEIEVPVVNETGTSYTIDFGDGTSLINQTGLVSHIYTTPGVYTVSMSGNFSRLDFSLLTEEFSANQLLTIEQWGDIEWTSMHKAFYKTSNLEINASDAPNLSQVTDLSYMFFMSGINQSINNWDVSTITNMSYTFSNTYFFDQTLNNWDVSNVTDMSYMFRNSGYNQPLDNWDVSSVVNMSHMFYAASFNQPIESWDVSNVTDMSYMFYQSDSFEQPLAGWDVSGVNNMAYMFNQAINFNQPIGNWDVSNVTDMSYMFFNAFNFNQPLNNWDVSSVTTMSRMFYSALNFNQPVGNWDVSNVTDMMMLFHGADSFNQPLNDWDVSNVTEMGMMFRHATLFNQPLNNWDVSNVVNMGGIFEHASNFNQDISSWEFNPDLNFATFIGWSNLDSNNYDALLLRFAQLGIEDKYTNAFGAPYCDAAVRDYLINELSWEIEGDWQDPDCEVNTLTGVVTFDQDNNGCNETDILINNILIGADNTDFTYSASTNIDGVYTFNLVSGTYEILVLGLPEYYSIASETTTIVFNEGISEEVLNFCVTANQSTEDLNVTILPVNEARPGFEAEYQLVVENIGTQTVTDATVSFTYNDAMQSFVSAVPAASSNSDNVLTFNLSDFQPFESRVIDITMETFTPPTVNGDDILNFTTTVTPNENDYTPQDNTFEFAQTVVNSFDPNDKRVVQGAEIYIEQATEYLDYIIRFQNTGTASAINIRVEDILSDDVDWSTFRPVSSSHDYRIEITDDNHVEFIFENINLPFEEEDEAGSNGFIAYKIKPVAGLEVGDIINSNEVNIYFDYNLPIVTNSVTTQIIELLGISDNILNKSLVLYPNPANDVLYIKAENNVLPEEVVIYNLQGRELMSFNQNPESMDISDLSAGIYLVTVQTNSGRVDYRLVKK